MSRSKRDETLAWKLGAWVGKSNRVAKSAWRAVSHRVVERQGQDPALAEWYANLELPYGSDLDSVRRARKRLLARYHPDRHAADPARTARAAELTLAINRAHDSLVERLTR